MIIAQIIPLEVRTIDGRRDAIIPRAARVMYRALEGIASRAHLAFVTATDVTEGIARAELQVIGERSRRDLRQALGKVYQMTIPVFAQLEFDRISKKKRALGDAIWAEFIVQFLNEEAGLFIRRVTATTLAQVRQALIDGVEQGYGMEKIGREMRKVVQAFNRKRALRIARTEVITASNAATAYGAGQTGLELNKIWLATTTDDRTRETHIEAHLEYHKTPIAHEELFYVGGYACMYPAMSGLPAKERINCRCTHYHVPVERWY